MRVDLLASRRIEACGALDDACRGAIRVAEGWAQLAGGELSLRSYRRLTRKRPYRKRDDSTDDEDARWHEDDDWEADDGAAPEDRRDGAVTAPAAVGDSPDDSPSPARDVGDDSE